MEPHGSTLGQLTAQLHELRQRFDVLLRSGRWLIWLCTVTEDERCPSGYSWVFEPVGTTVVPDWLDIERVPGEQIEDMLDRARFEEDVTDCSIRAHHAIRSGATGYTQTFRLRLRNGLISWVEENVTIERVRPGVFHLTGVCIDATARKRDEKNLRDLQEELIAQNAELQAMRSKLEHDKRLLAEANTRLENLATTDSLTGVKNHRAFHVQSENDWNYAVRYHEPLAVIMVDIDRFKQFNDTFGHPAGDEALVDVARLLCESVREVDCVARYGGEEFGIVLPHTDYKGAMALAERLRSTVANAPWDRRPITISLGVAAISPMIHNVRNLIEAADRALYQSKMSGRNCVRGADGQSTGAAR